MPRSADQVSLASPESILAPPLPRWRGFNLCEMFVQPDDPRWRDMTPAGRGRFVPDHFAWIADWGFNFVRLPLSYRYWGGPSRPYEITEAALAPVDEALESARRHGLHLCLNIHHAPGFCINSGLRDDHLAPEPFDLWTDPEAPGCFAHHWTVLARRYRYVPPGELSFDLVNEPARCTHPAYAAVVRAAVSAIRAVSPDRPVVIDGLDAGNTPCPDLADLGLVQSCRGYWPSPLTHHRAWWAGDPLTPAPAWPAPANESEGLPWTPESLDLRFASWLALQRAGTPVFCGELGCYHHTPHRVFLAWLEDHLARFREWGFGWALWNFHGSFGVLDHGRPDAPFVDWHGHRLDPDLLALLRRY